MFIMNAEIKKRGKVKGKYLKMYICLEKFRFASIVTSPSLSLGTYASAKLRDFRTSRVILLKGWSLCTPRLEQHRLSSGKNPRKSFLPFPASAKRRRHESFFFPLPLLLPFAYLFHPPFPTLPFVLFASPSLISLLQVRGLREARKFQK